MWNPFKKKKQRVALPNRFALVRFTKHAKELGIFDDENKVVEIYKRGVLSEPPIPYSEELVKALESVDEIPVINEEFDEEQFSFIESADFGGVEFRRWRYSTQEENYFLNLEFFLR